jgi:hypothetical protein
MSELNRGFSRRTVIGGGVAAALGITALAVTVPGLLRKRYRQTPYDDLLGRLVDRDAAVIVGKAARAGSAKPQEIADELRQRIGQRTLIEVSRADIAQGELAEVHGWVLPKTVVMLSTLAALES